jgi:hypothetical protein
MRLPRLRFTIRLLMLMVALAACSVWGYRMWRVSREHARVERRLTHFRIGRPIADAAEKAAYDAALARKYERAARHPWLPVGPDPPQP